MEMGGPKSMWGGCCRLDLEYPPKAHVLKAGSLACGAIGRWWNLNQVEPSGRMLGYWWGVALRGLLRPCLLPVCLFASQLPLGELVSAMMHCAATGSSNPGLKSLKLLAKTNLSSFSVDYFRYLLQ
jgi:hypothetical protein